MKTAAGVAYLIIRGDGEDLTALDPDPLRLVRRPATAQVAAAWIAAAAVLTAAAAAFVAWAIAGVVAAAAESGEPFVSETTTATSLAGIIPAIGITIAAWICGVRALHSRTEPARLGRAYEALVRSSARASFGTVRRCSYSSGETSAAYNVEVDIEMPSGRVITARERRGAPTLLADGTSSAYTPHQVPQFGDAVAVFTGPGLTIVQANHSWSALRGVRAGRRAT